MSKLTFPRMYLYIITFIYQYIATSSCLSIHTPMCIYLPPYTSHTTITINLYPHINFSTQLPTPLYPHTHTILSSIHHPLIPFNQSTYSPSIHPYPPPNESAIFYNCAIVIRNLYLARPYLLPTLFRMKTMESIFW